MTSPSHHTLGTRPQHAHATTLPTTQIGPDIRTGFTGARREDSNLFSLAELTASAEARPRQPSHGDDAHIIDLAAPAATLHAPPVSGSAYASPFAVPHVVTPHDIATADGSAEVGLPEPEGLDDVPFAPRSRRGAWIVVSLLVTLAAAAGGAMALMQAEPDRAAVQTSLAAPLPATPAPTHAAENKPTGASAPVASDAKRTLPSAAARRPRGGKTPSSQAASESETALSIPSPKRNPCDCQGDLQCAMRCSVQ